MAKAGMRRPDPRAPHGEHDEKRNIPRNEAPPVPEIKGKSKSKKERPHP